MACVRGDAEVRCALEHGELRGLFRDLRYGLNRRGTGADDPDPHAREVDALVGPLTGVIRGAAEDLSAVEAGSLRGRETAGRHDAECARTTSPWSVVTTQRFVSSSKVADSTRLELDVTAEVEPVGDEVEVAEDLGLGRITLGPPPLLQLLGE